VPKRVSLYEKTQGRRAVARARKVIITCAVTGSIHTPSMSPYLPITAEEGYEPGEIVTYFCRVHPSMRGGFEVVP